MMDQAVTRAAGATPSTIPPAAVTPRLVGEFRGYVDGADGVTPSVRWFDRKNMPQVGDKLYALPPRAAVPRSWSILLTSANHGTVGPLGSANHGTVGPLGSAFPHAGERHERVQVMEIVEAGAAPAPGTDLGGLVRLPLTNEQIDDTWDSIPAAFTRGQGEQEWNREKRRAFARAIEREVAAQAGQVAVPEGWKLVPAEPTAFMVGAGARAQLNADAETQANSMKIARVAYAAMLAAAPSAPAVEQQAPAASQAQIEWGHDLQARLVELGEDLEDGPRNLMSEAACLLVELTGPCVELIGTTQPEGKIAASNRDAARYGYIATLQDWSEIERLCRNSAASSAAQFKCDLDKIIDARLPDTPSPAKESK